MAGGRRIAPTVGEHRGRPLVHPASREELRAWLEVHHATCSGAWLVGWRRSTGRPAVPYDDIVEEALCFGWIDSTVNVIDQDRAALLLTPRRKGSVWAASNRARVERLVASGRMTDAGLAAVERAKHDGSWTAYEAAERLEEPPDLAAALDADPAARRYWASFPPSERKRLLWWVASAKRHDTRERRVREIVDRATRGERP
jgi:uncharacterized protein YdeI (YjbR/CyaY-like superfamily)